MSRYRSKIRANAFAKLMCWLMAYMVTAMTIPIQAVLAATDDIKKAVESATEPKAKTSPGPAPRPDFKVRKRSLVLSASATDSEIESVRIFAEPLIPMNGKAVAGENQALVKAVTAFSAKKNPEDLSDLTNFLQRYTKSRWHAALELNLGLLRYDTGYISDAIKYWQSAWDESKGEKGQQQMAIANRAYGELAVAQSRLGKKTAVQKLFAEAGDRPLQGSVAERIKNARYGIWAMDHLPGDSFKCGPYAVNSILNIGKKQKLVNAAVKATRSTSNGTNLTQIKELTDQTGLNYQIAKRTAGAQIVVPSIFHWKIGHFAAILSQKDGRYFLNDPTFDQAGNRLLSKKAIEAESDGYFLIPAGPLPPGWKAVSKTEADSVWGKGEAFGWDFGPQNCHVMQTACGSVCGMTTSSAYKSQATLHLQDVPLSYSPPIGVPMTFLVNYNYLEGAQPSNFTFSNLGQDWTFNWCSYLSVDSSNNLTVRPRGGGYEYYPYTPPPDNFTSPYAPDLYSQAHMSQAGGGYQRQLPDGTIEVFGLQDTGTTPTSYFMTQVIDPQGNATTINYDNTYRITTITDALNQQTTVNYVSNTASNSGYYKIASIVDPWSRSCTFTYDSANTFLLSTTDCIGIKSSYSYLNGGSFIFMLQTPYGVTSFYSYGDDATNGLVTTYPDQTADRIESHLGILKSTYYWDRENVARYPSDPYQNPYPLHAETTVWELANAGNGSTGVLSAVPWTIKKQLESTITYSYDGMPNGENVGTSNKPTQICQGPDAPGSPNDQYYSYRYNSFGHMTDSVDPVNRTFKYRYASNDIDLLEIRQDFGTNNDLLAKWEYNNSQHLANTYINGSGQTTNYTYNSFGELTSITDANSNTWTATYQSASSPYLSTFVGPSTLPDEITTVTFDSVGRLKTFQDSLGYVRTFSYDSLDRIISVTYPDTSTEITTYNLLDPASFQDRLGRMTTASYDNMQQLSRTYDPLGNLTQYFWCSCGSISHIIDPNGNETTWQRDDQGRVLKKVYPDGSSNSCTYDANFDRLSSTTDALGQIKSYSYNVDNTVSQITYSQVTQTTPNRSFTYDPYYLRLVTASDSFGTITYTYNPYITDPFASAITGGGQVSSIANSAYGPTGTITFLYDKLNRPTSKSVNGSANTESWVYDAVSRVTSNSNILGNFTYDYLNPTYGTNQLAKITYPAGSTTKQQSTFNWYPITDHVQAGQLSQISNVSSLGSNLSQFGQTYNPVQTITQWSQQLGTSSANTLNIGYDLADNLKSTTGSVFNYNFTYDAASNRIIDNNNGTTTTATVNNLNQIAALSGGTVATLKYDLNGSLISDGTNSYYWDGENRLSQVNYPGTNNFSQFTYDAMGRLTRIVEFSNGIPSNTKQFLQFAGGMLEERDASNSIQAMFFDWGQTRSGTSLFYTIDHLGSTRDVTDASGATVRQYTYDPYGTVSSTGTGLQVDFQYAGYYYHTPSGLNITRNRAYSATLGRFINRDPIEEAGGLNLYAYVSNNPIMNIDPRGLDGGSIIYNSQNMRALANDTRPITKPVVDYMEQPCTGEQYQNNIVIGIYIGLSELGGELAAFRGGAAAADAGDAAFGAGGSAGAQGGGASSCKTPSSGNPGGPPPTFGPHHTEQQWANRMTKGRWTIKEIIEVIKRDPNPRKVKNLVHPGNEAWEYYDPSTRRFVVVDPQLNEIIQISGTDYNRNFPIP